MNDEKKIEAQKLEEHVIAIREGHGANCSSIGSVIDMLFVAQIAAGAMVAAVAAAIVTETESESETETESETGTETESETGTETGTES